MADHSKKLTKNAQNDLGFPLPVPIFFIDGNHLFCEGLKHLLSDSPFEVAGEVANLREFDSAPRHVPDGSILLLDFPDAFHVPPEELGILRSRYPTARLVILTSLEDQASFFECAMARVDGYLLKNISPLILIESLRLVALGEKVFPSVLATWLIDSWTKSTSSSNRHSVSDADLSRREIDVLQCLVDGSPNKTIARKLFISDATVKVHVKNILRKVRAANRTQAAIWALTTGIIGDGRFVVEGDPRMASADDRETSDEANAAGAEDENVG